MTYPWAIVIVGIVWAVVVHEVTGPFERCFDAWLEEKYGKK